MEAKPTPQNIQDAFLNTVRREKSAITIYLLHGAKLSGRIKSFDKFSVLLESGANELLIFKHAISTISHARRVSGDLRPADRSMHQAADSSRPSDHSGSEDRTET